MASPFTCKACGAANQTAACCEYCGAPPPARSGPPPPPVTYAGAEAPTRRVVEDDSVGVSSFGQVCCSCRTYVSVPRKEMPGSTGLEILLWFFYIVPGVFYSMWRRNEDNWKPICANCHGKNFVPVSSPDGRRLFEAKYGRRPRFN